MIDQRSDHHVKRPIRCFLIEDDLDDQEIFCMALKEIDKRIECDIAHDGPQALQMLHVADSSVLDFIFLDVNMPKMNGVECLKEIKSLGRLENVKVFMFSTTSEKKLIETCMNLGASDFIVKPAGLSALTEKIRHAIGMANMTK